MSRPDLRDLVISSVATACGAERTAVAPPSELREIGLDSLSLVTVAALVESAAGIALDEAAAARLFEARTVAELVEIFEGAASRH